MVPWGVRSGSAGWSSRRCREYPSVEAFAMLCEATSTDCCCIASAVRAMLRMLESDMSGGPVEEHAAGARLGSARPGRVHRHRVGDTGEELLKEGVARLQGP